MVVPRNTTGNPLDSRLSFQIYHALTALFPNPDTAKADVFARDLAIQFESAGNWLWALFAVLHLSNRTLREQRIQDLLARHAANIDDSAHNILTQEFKIPFPWVWESKALYARTVLQDHIQEVHFLLLARNWEEAHQTLCHVVAPQMIIAQDHDTLQRLLRDFTGKNEVEDWGLGGQVYEDYLALLLDVKGQQRILVLRRLLGALPAMVQERQGNVGFEETVAVQVMSSVVGREALSSGDKVRFDRRHKDHMD